jgi:hypothetical protein
MPLARIDGLQIGIDMAFQRRPWRAQRAGWALVPLVALAGLLGLLGSGPLSEAARERHGLERIEQIKYAVLERSGGISSIPWDRVDKDHARTAA